MICTLQEDASMYIRVQKMKLYVDILENLDVQFPKELTIDMVLNAL